MKALDEANVMSGATSRLILGDAAKLSSLITTKFDKIFSVDAAYQSVPLSRLATQLKRYA